MSEWLPSFVPTPPKANPDAGLPYRDFWFDRFLVYVVRECALAFLAVFWIVPLLLGLTHFVGLFNGEHVAAWLDATPTRLFRGIHIEMTHHRLVQVALLAATAAAARRELAIGYYRRRGLVVRSHSVGRHGDVLPSGEWHHRDEHWCWKSGVTPPAPLLRRLQAKLVAQTQSE